MRHPLTVVFVSLFFLSCGNENKKPQDILEKKVMQAILWDLSKSDVFLNEFAGKNDTAFNRLKESVVLYGEILQMHKTNRDKFKKSLSWYQQHPDEMKTILDSLQAHQNRIMQQGNTPGIQPTEVPVIDTSKS